MTTSLTAELVLTDDAFLNSNIPTDKDKEISVSIEVKIDAGSSDDTVREINKDIDICKEAVELSTKGTDVTDVLSDSEGNILNNEERLNDEAVGSKKKKKKKNKKRRKKKKKANSTNMADDGGSVIVDDFEESENYDDEKLRFTELLNIDPCSGDNVDFSMLEPLIENYPQFCAETHKLDAFNDSVYPLSALCSIGAPVELVIKCIDAYEGALFEKDPWIGNPLHYACAYKADLPVVEALVQKRPDCLREANEFRRLPLHMACMFGASSDVIAYLLAKYTNASEVIDKDGLMPLHLACDGDDLSADIIKRLVEANPDACTVRSIANGWTPLVVALSNHADLEIVKIFGDAIDETHKIVDNEGNTALHVAVSSEADFEVCKYLVDSNQAAVTIKNQAGKTPLVLAEKLGADQAVLDILKAQA